MSLKLFIHLTFIEHMYPFKFNEIKTKWQFQFSIKYWTENLISYHFYERPMMTLLIIVQTSYFIIHTSIECLRLPSKQEQMEPAKAHDRFPKYDPCGSHVGWFAHMGSTWDAYCKIYNFQVGKWDKGPIWVPYFRSYLYVHVYITMFIRAIAPAMKTKRTIIITNSRKRKFNLYFACRRKSFVVAIMFCIQTFFFYII